MTASDVIEANVRAVLAELPRGVTLVAAVKSRTADEVTAAIRAGVTHIGHNYVQEAERMAGGLPFARGDLRWHMIGHLQRNKARAAVAVFDIVETVDSWELGVDIDRRAAAAGRRIPVLVEVNIAREETKSGVAPDDVDDLVRRLGGLPALEVQGLMTMGPRSGDPELARPYFRAARQAFDRLASSAPPGVSMRCLSMGMSNSYRIAIAEGANVVRIGTRLFGGRPGDTG